VRDTSPRLRSNAWTLAGRWPTQHWVENGLAGCCSPKMTPTPIFAATLAAATLFAVALTSCMSEGVKPNATVAPGPVNTTDRWADFQRTVRPFLAENCYKCHGEKTQEGDLRLDLLADAASLAKNHTTLEDALDRLSHHEMPPSTEPRPGVTQQAKVVAWLEGYLASGQSGPRDPGRVTGRIQQHAP
jgi:Planctomycete cytochrome C